MFHAIDVNEAKMFHDLNQGHTSKAKVKLQI